MTSERGVTETTPPPERSARAESAPRLVALHGAGGPSVSIEPAPRWRDWMNSTQQRWANRCLPLLIANEAGWVLLNESAFEARWDGDPNPSAVTIATTNR